jgi:23S rRNA pseudouridine1911/1915/1917 synthase
VVGDTLYGAPHQESIGREQLPSLGRNFLHAARIALEHPRTGQRMEFRAPLPQELVAYIRALGAMAKLPPGGIDVALRDYL